MAALNVNKAEFIRSAASPKQFIQSSIPSVVFAGKSNVGKSSVINRMLNRKNFARVGASPGKTIHVNYFLIDQKIYFVDLPGYGYAKASRKDREAIEEVIRNYLNFSDELRQLFILIDSRHSLTSTDRDFLKEVEGSDIDCSIIFTKADKQGPVATQRQVEALKAEIAGIFPKLPPCFVSSAEKGTGKEEILNYIEQTLTL